MQVLLRIANGKSNVRKVRLQSDTVIGRSPECQLKVASNQISRRHCQILIRESFVAIKDLGSANGTFVNGRKVPAEVEIPLTPGTRVMLGPLNFTVEYDLPGLVTASATDAEEVVETAAVGVETLNVTGTPREADADTIDQASPFGGLPDGPFGDLSPDAENGQTASFQNPFANVEEDLSGGAGWQPPLGDSAPAGLGDTAFSSPPVPAAAQTPPPAAVPVAAPIPVAAVVKPPKATARPAAPIPAVPAPSFDVAENPFSASENPLAEAPSEQDPGFNFGIFAASGSGVVVESAAEVPTFQPGVEAETPKAAKPAKKGFLEMLGWGKKKAVATASPAEPAPELAETDVGESASDVTPEPSPFSEGPFEAAAPSFEVVEDPKEQPAAGNAGTGDSLQDFFNNIK